jgi:hypothetical protein
MHIHIGDYTTLWPIYMQVAIQYYSTGLLYGLRQEKAKGMDWEQWNKAAPRHREQARKRSHAPTAGVRIWQWSDGKAHMVPLMGRPSQCGRIGSLRRAGRYTG